MGYMPISESKKVSPYGEKIKIDIWTYTDEYSDPEGCVCISISVTDNKNNIMEYRFDFPHKEYTEQWNDKFEDSFLYNKDYRKTFEVKDERTLEFDSAPSIPPLNDLQKKDKSIELQKEIKKINKKGGKFKDFMKLKSGRDKYSGFRKNALLELVEEDVISNKEIKTLEESDKLKVYRWILRGLTTENAIRKVKTDLEVSSNCK